MIFAIFGYFEVYPKESTVEALWTRPGDLSVSGDADDDYNTRQVEALLTLFHELLNAGADVNAVAADLDDMAYSAVEEWRKSEDAYPWKDLIHKKHSALTFASSFRCPELVDFLIRSGAEINFHVDGARSALRECLYNAEERSTAARKNGELLTVADRLEYDPTTRVSGVIETAKRLITAGVDVNDHKPCHHGGLNCKVHLDFECYSAFDLGVLTQDKDLIDKLWSAGARPTRHSFKLALDARGHDTFCRLLESEADFPEWLVPCDEWPVTPAEWPDTDDGEPSYYMEARNATERQKQTAMILAAIQLGLSANLESLTRSFDCSNLGENSGALRKAIELCCASGYRDTLVCLLQSNIVLQGSLASVFGSSISLAIYEGHPEMVDVLLAAGADANAAPRDSPGETPLHLAIHAQRKDLVQKLLNHRAEVKNPEYGNPLVQAVYCGDDEIIQLLMARASPNELGRSFEAFSYYTAISPLAAAIFKENWAVFYQLLRLGASVSPGQEPRPLRHGTPLWASVLRRRITTAQWLLENGAVANDELALKAAAEDEGSVLLRLLVAKLSTEVRSGEQNALNTALQTAMERGDLKNFRLILQSNVLDVCALSDSLHNALNSPVAYRQEFLQFLLDAGACPNTITLLEAISQRDPGCVKMILETRARTNGELPPDTGYSPLQLAGFEGNPEIVRMLLDYGQDPDVVSPCTTTYHWYSNSLRMNHPIGASVQNATMEKAHEVLKALLQHGAKPDLTTRHCPHSALQIACREGSMELVEVLVEYGANVNYPPAATFGATALQFAAIGGYLCIAHLLLEKGADVNEEPAESKGRTALEGAAEHGRNDMVQLLRNAGADISESGQGGQYERALRRAQNNGHFATAKLLRSFLS